MRAQALRKFAVTAAGLAIVSFCSCERHSADELHHGGGHGEAHGGEQAEHVKSHAAEKDARHDKPNEPHDRGDQQQMSTTALTPTPSPSPHH